MVRHASIKGRPARGRVVLLLRKALCTVVFLGAIVLYWDGGSYDIPAYYQYVYDGSASATTSGTSTSSASKAPIDQPAYICSAAQSIGSMSFFNHTDCPAQGRRSIVIPNEGFIFSSRYFTSIYETRVRDVFEKVLSRESSERLQRGVVLDIGGNSGWYTAYAAVCFGVHVHVFEPQEGCLDIMCPLVAHNDIQSLVTIHHNIVAQDPKAISIVQDCDPGFSPDHHLLEPDGPDRKAQVASIRAVDVVQSDQPVLMIKIDTEGTEMGVLSSIEPLLRDGRATNVVVEIKLKLWESDGHAEENIKEFRRLVYENGFKVYSLEKRVYVESENFENWLKTVGANADNNFWLQKDI